MPLDLRLPNAPPIFVGRRAEAARLCDAIARAPVTCVLGVGGLGKTALVCHVLHTGFAEHVPRVVMARVARGDALTQRLSAIARALADARGERGIDWAAIEADRDALLATLIDLAEPDDPKGAGRFVVIDDLHHGGAREAREVLDHLAQYARKSRWIAVSREDPGLSVMGQTVTLSAMPEGELMALVRAWGVGDDVEIVRAAAGSPFRLKQLLAGARPGHEPGTTSVLDGLDPAAADFLRALSVIGVELPAPVLARIAAAPSRDALDALVRRGLIERTPAGLRAHDVASALVAAELGEDALSDLRGRAAEALATAPDARARLEALRLAVEAGDPGRARRLFDEHGGALIEAGFALALHHILARAPAPELASWRLCAAAESGDASLLHGLPLPAAPSPADRAYHALALFHQGRYDEAARAAAEAVDAARAAEQARVAFDAGRTLARCSLDRGMFDEAREAFEALRAETPDQAAQRDVDLAVCAASIGQRARALELVTRVEERLDALSGGPASLRFGVAWVLYAIGAVRRAEPVVARLSPAAAPAGPRAHAFMPARHLILQAAIAWDRGALDALATVVDKLVPLAARSPTNAVFVRLVAARLARARGALDGLTGELAAVASASRAAARADMWCTAEAERTRVAIDLGAPPEALDDPSPGTPPSRWTDDLALARAAHASRWGLPFTWPKLAEPDMPEVAILAEHTRGVVALAAADAISARRAATASAALAAEHGYERLALEARVTALEALAIVDPQSPSLPAEAAALAEDARRAGAPPLAATAELLAHIASAEGLSPVELERVAALHHTTHAASRRARALLGEDVALDRIDRAVVEAAQRRARLRIEAVGARDDRSPRLGFTLDARRKQVLLPTRSVDFSERPLLFRVLEVIAAQGGEADKETLLRLAWQEPAYHPLRHDARLHTAVRALRKSIEDDPASPRRLVTTKEGYAFGEPVRRIVPS